MKLKQSISALLTIAMTLVALGNVFAGNIDEAGMMSVTEITEPIRGQTEGNQDNGPKMEDKNQAESFEEETQKNVDEKENQNADDLLFEDIFLMSSSEEIVEEDYNALTLENLCKVPPLDNQMVLDDLILPSMGKNGSEITWYSNMPAVLSNSGTVKRGIEDVQVTLTAVISKDDVSKEKTFLIVVPARRNEINGMPVSGNMIKTDDFSDGVIDSGISIQTAADVGTVIEEEGVLKITRNKSSNDNAAYFRYPNDLATGDLVTEFIINKMNQNQKMMVRSWGNGDLFRVDWNQDGHIWAYFSDTAGGSGYAHDMGTFETDKTAKFTIFYHLDEGTVDLWINNRLVCDNCYLNTPGNYLTGVTIYNVSADELPNTITVDDYKHFLAMEEMPDQERVDKDLVLLTYESLFKPFESIEGYISSNINLPNAGQNGSDIIWATSDENLVSLDGTVHRPTEGHGTVTLTMTVISGEVREERQFKLKILNANAEADALPMIEKMIYENDFSDNTLPNNFTISDSDGGKSSIKDGKLVLEQPAGGYCYTNIYFSPDSQPLKGMICVEYTLEQSGWGQWNQIFVKGGAWSDYLRAFYYGDGNTYLRYLNEDGTQGQYYGNYPEKYHLRILFDTEADRYSAWINDKLVVQDVRANNSTSAGEGIMSMQFATGNATFECMVKMDNLKVYYAIPPSYSVAAADNRWLTDSQIRTAPYVMDNIIDQDLNLVTKGRYGSDISWNSSHPDIISTDGKIHFPENVDTMPEVTLTATIFAYGFEYEKLFKFRVLRKFNSAEETLAGELEDLSYELLTAENPDSITSYLRLPAQGLYGHEIVWRSSEPLVITNAGRVIRPRWDMADKEVVLTASVSEGGITKSKDFCFMVKADTEYTDPQYMTDEEFFGQFDGSNWTTEGKLDYSRTELGAIESAVKEGNYFLAKEELLKHMRERTEEMSIQPATAREAGWADMRISDIYSLQGTNYYQGSSKVSSSEYETVAISVKAESVTKGGANTYGIISRYNESSSVKIISKEYPDSSMRPRLEVTVNGQVRVYEAEADAVIRAGEYADTCFGTESEMTVKMSGEFLGNETSRVLLRFNFSDILETDSVTNAVLVVNAKTEERYDCNKEIIVIYDPNNAWSEQNVCWNSLIGYVYNYNGLPGRNDWESPKGADAEYLFQSSRFFGWDILSTEYQYTRDEKYAYYMISDMMDFIWDKGELMYTTGSNWGGQNIRGGYPRTLDTSIRLQNQIPALLTLMKSRYMTPEICTAIMKNMWDMTDSLTKSKTTTGNWIQHENKGILHGGLSFPEFTKWNEWFDQALERLEALIYENHFDDGSYIEGTGGYSQSAYGDFIELKEILLNNGRDVSEQYNDMLHKAGYYNMLLNGPNGLSLQYGDQQGGNSYGDRRPELANWFQDDELSFISSFYRRGKEPEWTSKLFPDSKLSIMRSDWTKNALFCFTQVRGGGQHSHADDNAMTVMAYQRNLLVDPGIMTYTESDPNRIWGKSTRAHNTVEINNTSQNIGAAGKSSADTGSIYDWVSNDTYDFLSQSSKAYSGFEHRRTITFVKSGFWIVSDLIDPDNETKENSYKQSWHMLPNAGLTGNNIHKTISSNFSAGANIIVASADDDVQVAEEMGLHDYSYGQVVQSKYGYFSKEGIAGKATFDTVLLPYRNPGTASINVSRLDIGASASEATALRFDTVIEGKEETVQYMLDYEPMEKRERNFGDYQTTAKLALVRSSGESIKEVILNQSSGINTSDGKVIVDLGSVYSDFSFEITGDTLNITTAEENIDASKMKLCVTDSIKNVTLNGDGIAFVQKDGNVTLIDQSVDSKPELDPSQGGGIVDRNPTGGSGGSVSGGNGSSISGGNSDQSDQSGQDASGQEGKDTEDEVKFADIEGHWAEQDILTMAKKGIVQGSDGFYRPEDSVTRAEMVTVMIRSANLSAMEYAKCFSDIKAEDWYAGYIQAALSAGFISPDVVFRPNDPITREEMSKLLYMLSKRMNRSENTEYQELVYMDVADISDWAVDYVKYVSAQGIMQGDENHMFYPQGNATRAEMAAVLNRILQ